MTDTSLTGWAQPAEVVRLLQWLSYYIGYSRDWHEEQALIAALENTDPKAKSSRFGYSLEGWPPLTVQLWMLPHHSSVSVTVTGATEATLRFRVATMLDVFRGSPPLARRT